MSVTVEKARRDMEAGRVWLAFRELSEHTLKVEKEADTANKTLDAIFGKIPRVVADILEEAHNSFLDGRPRTFTPDDFADRLRRALVEPHVIHPLDSEDVRVDVERSRVNLIVRATHVPTGVVGFASGQTEPEDIVRNRAMDDLLTKLEVGGGG